MRPIDDSQEEPIRRWPVWFARFANRVLGWTDYYCSGGCGYPVNGLFEIEIDKIDDVRVVMVVCSLGGECAVNTQDAAGQDYGDIRPGLLSLPRDVDAYRLSFGR